MKIVLLNGPPYSGKTEVSSVFQRQFLNKGFSVHRDSFATPNKNFLATLIGERYDHIKKDEVHPVTAPYTPRQFLIKLSEEHLKPTYGKDFFGRAFGARIDNLILSPTFIISDDLGFIEELNALELRFVPNIRIVHISRPGKDFSSDSRSYITSSSPLTKHYSIENDGTLDQLNMFASAIARLLMQEEGLD